ncbi:MULTISPECIES: hypothetical protein [Clostridia]|uniref:hypothetical protein n=1 Tax=Clostridia TaxID=186801 RepID=UPI0007406EDC|nr:hypothetical protein [Clostridium sp. C105KSO13]CUX28371.1 hypothetical protein BN3456_01078 [Clostridium sp. C105KSO13]HAX51790.1 hypothetical protein [Lachnospiraceae bacterium]
MKTFMEEYGKVIALVIVLVGLILYVFGSDAHGLLGELSKVKGVETVGDADNSELLSSVGSRDNPTLEVKPKKLRIGNEYNLLDKNEYYITARNADDAELAVSVKSIISPEGEALTGFVNPNAFKPDRSGIYVIKYETHEVYKTFVKTTEKDYQFVVD